MPEQYKFQQYASKWLAFNRRAVLSDDLGIGKSNECIIATRYLKTRRNLVIVPNSLKRNWENELALWYPKAPVVVSRGDYNERINVIKEFEQGFLIVNYESVRKNTRQDNLLKELLLKKWDCLICDEAHRLKNRKAQQTLGVKLLSTKIPNLFLLTGTPIQNRFVEIWPLLNMIDHKKYSSFWAFAKKYGAAPGPYGWVIPDRPNNPDALKKELEPLMLRRLKEDLLDMPAKTYQKIWLDMDPFQREYYDKLANDWFTQIDDKEINITVVLAEIIRLKQMCINECLILFDNQSNPSNVTGSFSLRPKIEAILDIIEGTNQKIVITSQFERAIKLLSTVLDKVSIKHVLFTGKVAEEDRINNVTRFNNDPDTQIFLMTTQAGGEGINLQSASIMIFIDKLWNPSGNEQAVARIYRHGQKLPVTIIELLMNNSIEEDIEFALASKIDLIQRIISMKTMNIKIKRRIKISKQTEQTNLILRSPAC